jgi:EAL domain-containing protein (putative c-di-GMP-specific phosphodiesterase class I)
MTNVSVPAHLSKFSQHTDKTSLATAGQMVPVLLRALRTHFQMDAAFVSRFEDGHRVFTYVDEAPQTQLLRPGDSDPLEESYCQRVVDGRLPQVIQDAQDLPAARELPVTAALPVGAHLSVPIRLQDGSVYGTLCCFSFRGNRGLTDAHGGLMGVLADLVSGFVEREQHAFREQIAKRSLIASVLHDDALSMVYQPIKTIENGNVVGFEALARFSMTPARSPDVWFREAAEVGLGRALELRAIEKALVASHTLPADVYVSCNVSAEVAMEHDLLLLLEHVPLNRVLLEITEHSSVADYEEFRSRLAPLRQRGLRLAVDDAGAGYASFRHILSLQPDVIKLDISLTRDIDAHAGRRALAAAFIGFAQETGCRLVAEGVETAAELATLRALGVHEAQGYFIGRPAPLETALEPFASKL